MTSKLIILLLALNRFVMTPAFALDHGKNQNNNPHWPEIKKEHKPGIYWWWMGSAVDTSNLNHNLNMLHDAGIGSMTIVPIYGVKGYEHRFIDYLSPKWIEMLSHTIRKAGQLDMQVDMTTGTGWPFGGSHVTREYAAKKVECTIYNPPEAGRLDNRIDKTGLLAVIASSDRGEVLNLSEKLDQDGIVDWTFSEDKWDVYVVHMHQTNQQVKRAAPGNMGKVIDPFSTESLGHYLKRFDHAFAEIKGTMPRSQYHDSFEYYDANWTSHFFEEFKNRRGYDLLEQLPLFFGDGDDDLVARVKSDYRETLSDLHLEYIRAWNKWSHEMGCQTRNQAHGAPGNLLDLYAAADIPETEIFGSSSFNIPGLRRNPGNIDPKNMPQPLINKFASSAAHVSGKRLIASETATWLRDHFKTALSQIKPEIDQLFLAGINHLFYHGNAYSPKDAVWPGWLFYASTHFEPENAIWRDLPALNSYVSRCQSILQSGEPDNDILMYWPVYDLWHKADGMTISFSVHDAAWHNDSPAGKTAALLSAGGFSFDYISDAQLQNVSSSGDGLKLGDLEYRTILIPRCEHMPVRTLRKLVNLAANGATVLVEDHLPDDVPGFAGFSQRREEFNEIISRLNLHHKKRAEIEQADVGDGQFIVGDVLEEMLKLARVSPEPVANAGIGFIRRSHEDGIYYFLSNLKGKAFDGWISMAKSFTSAVILDPLTSKSGIAAIKNKNGRSELYLQLQPGESIIVKTFQSRIAKGSNWRYLSENGRPVEISGEWKVDFVEGRPELPAPFATRQLDSWTKLGDKNAQRFAGTARYTIAFDLSADVNDDWILDLGRVCESARIRINNQDAGVLFSIPFRAPVGRFLRRGENVLEVEVTNLSANLIADLDKRKVNWKRFHDINFVNIHYKEFDASDWELMDSGLLRPVFLHPMKLKDVFTK